MTGPAPRRPRLRFAGDSEILDTLEWREFTCPGCGRAVRLRATPNVTIEWKRVPDGRYLGLLMKPAGLLNDYVYEVDIDAVITATGGGHMADRAELPAELVDMLRLPPDVPTIVRESIIHDCASGGTANDRAEVAPEAPSSQSSESSSLPQPRLRSCRDALEQRRNEFGQVADHGRLKTRVRTFDVCDVCPVSFCHDDVAVCDRDAERAEIVQIVRFPYGLCACMLPSAQVVDDATTRYSHQ